MIAGIVLAASLGVIPITPAMERFPDPSWWPGSGVQQTAAMLSEIMQEAGREFVTSAPGPQQLAVRFASGELSEEERVAVLLGGALFRHPALVPAYVQAARSGSLRERQAAAVGLAWLLGDSPPLVSQIPDTPEAWRSLRRAARFIEEAARTRTLVAIWVDSYLSARGLPRRPGLVLERDPFACLQAIQQLAGPDDLGELVALWPLLAEDRERALMVSILETVTVQGFLQRPRGARAPSGGFLVDAAVQMVDSWVRSWCRSDDGWQIVLANASRLGGGEWSADRPELWLRLLSQDAPFAWPVAAEMLVRFGAPAIYLNRRLLESTDSSQERARALEYFGITREALRRRR